FSSRRRHTRSKRDWSSDVCSSDLITRVAEVMNEAALHAGAPQGAISWMTTVTLEGTQELMKHRDVAVILATGGMGLVRAAYSARSEERRVGKECRCGGAGWPDTDE